MSKITSFSAARNLHVVILAAGEGRRMRSRLPKVLQPVGGRPMLAHVLEAVRELEPDAVHVVHGHGGEQVVRALDGPDIRWVEQSRQLGTGHALQQALPGIPGDSRVLVLMGDHPLVPPELLRQLAGAGCDVVLVTTRLPDPAGYGRILRDRRDRFAGIVEQQDATAEQLAIDEVNCGIYCFPAARLPGWLKRLRADNAAGENYLTDVPAMAVADGLCVQTLEWPQPEWLQGANDAAQLAELERLYQRRQVDRLLADGARVADPARIDIRGRLAVGRDVFIDCNTVFQGDCHLEDGVRVGPGCVLRDCRIGRDTEILASSVLADTRCGAACRIGPFAHCRPGTRLGDRVRIGNFVETKQAAFGTGAKAGHLSYLGDANIGQEVNIGAGTITCNYDGVTKHITEIGNGAFIGSGTELVAPVSVGDGAWVGAGSTITEDAPAGRLTLARSRQVTIENWQPPANRDSRAGGGN